MLASRTAYVEDGGVNFKDGRAGFEIRIICAVNEEKAVRAQDGQRT